MTPRPRQTIDDNLIEGVPCAICGNPSVQVVHVKDYPDYVTCSECKSAFVVEDGGERVMYGSVPAGYPETRKLAVRQWVALDDIEASAMAERPAPARPPISASVPIPTLPEPPRPPDRAVALTVPEPEPAAPPPPARPAQAAPPSASPLDRLAALAAAEPPPKPAAAPPPRPEPAPVQLPAEPPKSGPAATPRIEAIPPVPAKAPAKPAAGKGAPAPQAKPKDVPLSGPGEPPHGERYRVVAKGPIVTIPLRVCAHCLRSPAPKRLAVVGRVPQGQGFTRPRPMTFHLPLCADCDRRAKRRGDEERNARLQAHLISALFALVILVAGLAFNVIELQRQPLIGLFLVVLFLAVGYSLPATMLLGRASRFPLPRDAAYIRTTLHIAQEMQGPEVPFEWRNRNFAEIFLQANPERTVGAVTKIKDRLEEPEAPAVPPPASRG